MTAKIQKMNTITLKTKNVTGTNIILMLLPTKSLADSKTESDI